MGRDVHFFSALENSAVGGEWRAERFSFGNYKGACYSDEGRGNGGERGGEVS